MRSYSINVGLKFSQTGIFIKRNIWLQTDIQGEGHAMIEAERLNDEGKLLDNDYEELAEYLESLLIPVEEETPEEVIEENTEEIPENEE